MSRSKRVLYPLGAGLVGMLFLSGLYFGIMTWAEGFRAARALFWNDRWIVIPILLGFGIQSSLYAILKLRLFVPIGATGPSGALMGASGTTSTVAMLACCAHHVIDVLPILGLTATTTFLARYRLDFMWAALAMTLAGIMVMLIILFNARHKALQMAYHHNQTSETL
jgi:Cu+-exporting ATPase